MSELFDAICKSYFEKELKKSVEEVSETHPTFKCIFSEAINEPSISLTLEQVRLMWAILTPEQLKIIEKSFQKYD